MKRCTFAVFALTVATLVWAADTKVADPEVAYPEGYRHWHHVKSMVINQGHPLHGAFGGIHHLYANAKAVAGYPSGQFADGAVIVFDLLEAQAADNAITEGARKVVGVMQKDAKKFAATGGWGFEGFAAGDRSKRVVGADAASACFACHAPQKEHDFVFSRPRD
ncbi:MAG: cytochrome C [Lysobacterales bacterium CG02_land_8_20_14_3_00_62_12]|nr:MAG: cytochrome C [Xanthomonadales bacterium CG02_land_8_20_14_3_00_62_12]